MKNISRLALVFSVLSLVFIILSVFLRFRFRFFPLMSYQDALDVLTPLALLPVYWLLFKYVTKDAPTRVEEIVFVLLAAVWVEGHGMHLSSNSIDNLLDAMAHNPATDLKGTDVYRLTLFYDEELAHYIWHLGMIGLAALPIYLEWHHTVESFTAWRVTIAAGFVYGFSLFCIFDQARTEILGFPFFAAVLLSGLIWGRGKLGKTPVLAFFFVSCLVAVILFAIWGFYWRGFPQFTAAGLI